MEFAYLDESGDPGAKGSKKIVMCLVCTNERKKLNKVIIKTKQRLLEKNKTKKWLYRNGGEIKFYSFPDKNLLVKTLKELAQIDINVYYVCFDKNKSNFNARLKHSIMGDLFWHVFERGNKKMPQNVVSDLDFFGKKHSYFTLIEYKKKKIETKGEEGNKEEWWKDHITFTEIPKEEYEKNKKDKNFCLIKIEPKNSRYFDELQAVDLICGSIFQYVERGNLEYFNVIRGKIIRGTEYKINK